MLFPLEPVLWKSINGMESEVLFMVSISLRPSILTTEVLPLLLE
jgi:hypothetical protein